jgi:PP-loop superfamily ATP-utilizing enzyme
VELTSIQDDLVEYVVEMVQEYGLKKTIIQDLIIDERLTLPEYFPTIIDQYLGTSSINADTLERITEAEILLKKYGAEVRAPRNWASMSYNQALHFVLAVSMISLSSTATINLQHALKGK